MSRHPQPAQITIRAALGYMALAAWVSVCAAMTVHGTQTQGILAGAGFFLTGIALGLVWTFKTKLGCVMRFFVGTAFGGGAGLAAWGAVLGIMDNFGPRVQPLAFVNTRMGAVMLSVFGWGAIGIVLGGVIGLVFGILIAASGGLEGKRS